MNRQWVIGGLALAGAAAGAMLLRSARDGD